MYSLKKEKNIIFASIIFAAIISIIFSVGFSLKLYADSIQSGIADKVVRLHILADNDSPRDQQLKLMVRDEVQKVMKEKIKNSSSKAETIKILEENKYTIITAAEKVLRENNNDCNVNVKFEKTLFPIRKYNSFIFPSGYYDAVKIEIGSGKGHNWWCVMYPSLCLYEDNDESGTRLENILTPGEYSVVYDSDGINIKLATVEAVKEIERYFNKKA